MDDIIAKMGLMTDNSDFEDLIIIETHIETRIEKKNRFIVSYEPSVFRG